MFDIKINTETGTKTAMCRNCGSGDVAIDVETNDIDHDQVELVEYLECNGCGYEQYTIS
jgi:alpha-L-arabinofuranosidase